MFSVEYVPGIINKGVHEFKPAVLDILDISYSDCITYMVTKEMRGDIIWLTLKKDNGILSEIYV